MPYHTESYHWVMDLFLLMGLLFMTTLYFKSKVRNPSRSSQKLNMIPSLVSKVVLTYKNIIHREEYERKFLDTLKDLQDLKYALDESNIVQIVDKDANILYANERFCHLSGYSFEELEGKNMRMFNSNYHSNEYFKDLWRTVTEGNVWRGEMRNKGKNSSYFWVNTTIVPFLDKDQKPFQYIVIRNDITQSKENEKKLEHLSNVDGLTSLFNRRYFDRMIECYWEALLNSQNNLSVILFDVDYFKRYNDYYGHILGDQCLIDISHRVKELMSPFEAVCARLGGEEFAVLLPFKDSYEAHFIAERIRLEIEQLNIFHEMSNINKRVTLSLGVASVKPTQEMNTKDLLDLADQALYHAKNNGRNKVAQYAASLQAE